jgi:hypothetical protein
LPYDGVLDGGEWWHGDGRCGGDERGYDGAWSSGDERGSDDESCGGGSSCDGEPGSDDESCGDERATCVGPCVGGG